MGPLQTSHFAKIDTMLIVMLPISSLLRYSKVRPFIHQAKVAFGGCADYTLCFRCYISQ